MTNAARGAKRLVAVAATLLCHACGEPPESRPSADAPPISGEALDAVQRDLREILDRELAGLRAEHVRIEKSSDGRRVIVHAGLDVALSDAEYEEICRALSEAVEHGLVEGQSLEAHLMAGGTVVHACGL